MDSYDHLIGIEGLQVMGIDLPAFADGLPGGFFIYEAHGEERILFANRQMADIFSCESVNEFLDLVGGTFPGLVYHHDRLRVENSIWSQINSGDSSDPSHRDHVTYRVVDKNGVLRYIDEYGRLVQDTKLGDLFFVFVAEISSAKGAIASDGRNLVHPHVSVDVDALTGLPSMRYYHSHTSEVLARASIEGTPMVDVYFDVDHFRTINFRLGYEGGDEVLQHVASILQDCFPKDLLARFSDDHFVLVTRREGLEDRLTHVHDRVSRMVSGMPVEIKAGIFELSPNDVTIPFAHDRAKVACNAIKGRYDQFYRFYDDSLSINEELRDYIINHIEQAAEQGWIRNYYQPVVRVATRTCCSVEALSRWFDPELGMLPPAQYIHVLEEARLIHLLDRAVINRSCADIKLTLKRLGTAVPVSLNFSPSALAIVDVPALVDETVRRYDIPKKLVHVEITESSLTEDPELLRSVIKRLHTLGYDVWMDDFGSGYSSLNLLKDYDFDVLKVDMEFLRGMEGNKKSRTIVHSITNLAHSLNMTTLVEGVETEGQLAFLNTVGADRAQGFLFSEPIPYEAIIGDFFLRYPPERL
ncbi:MAG: GGDEF domain-containing protein [Atopobiaceae bacterium]|nr:GGDEF domain-containing protein [Atopobiaceae bacterium]